MNAAAERTAHLVASYARMGLAKRPRRVPRSRFPSLLEAEYATALVGLVNEWRSEVLPLLDDLPSILAAARVHRGDEAEFARCHVLGLEIAIENPAGSVRHWVDSDGTEGSTVMKWDYGCFVGVRGADGEDVDVYRGPITEPESVFIVHQLKKSSGFTEPDEDKIMIGFASADDAKAAYLAQYDDPRFFGTMTVLSSAEFVLRMRAAKMFGVEVRLDESQQSYRVRSHTTRARGAVTRTLERVPVIAVRTARRATDHQKNEFMRQTEAALGVKVPTVDAGIDQRIQHFVHENVSLIQKLGEKTIGDVEGVIARAFTTGQDADEVAAEIMRRFDIAERHARFIARDQMQRLYSQVTRMRHKETGVAAFQWWTQGDGHVRSSHAVKHKKIFPYEGSRAPSFFPGDDVGCRCWEEPVFEEIKAKARELLGKGRRRVA